MKRILKGINFFGISIFMATQKTNTCPQRLRAASDALDAINGKWKIPILIALSFGNRRFRELTREIPGISPKMLSKELKELENNTLIERSVYDTTPVTVEYSLTPLGKSLDSLLEELYTWGDMFRKKIIGKA
jgi:Predicted transcriptional regulators